MKAPKQPSPADMASAQANVNNQQAQLNQAYGLGAFTDPYGTQSSTQTGTRTIPAVTRVNKKGKTVVVTPAQEVPVYTTTRTLSPEQQGLLNQQQQFGAATNQLGIQQVGQLTDLLSKPLDLSNDAVSGYITDLYRKRLDPMWDAREQQYETELRNQGLQPGNPAYNDAMNLFRQGRNDAYDKILTSARAQSVQEMIAARNQPINETTALMSGGQVTPFVPPGQNGPSVGGVDFAAMQANAYNQKNAQYNAMLGGLFDLGGATIQAVGPQALRSMGSGSGGTTTGPGGWSYAPSGSYGY